MKQSTIVAVVTLAALLFLHFANAGAQSSDDLGSDVRRAACEAEVLTSLGERNEDCLAENSMEVDECSDIDEFKSRMRCKKRSTRNLERCFDRANDYHRDRVRICQSLN